MRQHLLRVPGYVGEDVADAVAEVFQAEHGFPVLDGKPDSVAVDGDYAGVQLWQKVSRGIR